MAFPFPQGNSGTKYRPVVGGGYSSGDCPGFTPDSLLKSPRTAETTTIYCAKGSLKSKVSAAGTGNSWQLHRGPHEVNPHGDRRQGQFPYLVAQALVGVA